jgi:hypothetical protein
MDRAFRNESIVDDCVYRHRFASMSVKNAVRLTGMPIATRTPLPVGPGRADQLIIAAFHSSNRQTPMARGRPDTLYAAGYAVAAALAIGTLIDLGMRLRPVRLAEATWRIGATGTISLELPTLLLAAFVALVTASLLQHTRVLRVTAAAFAVAAILALAILPFFALDVIQLRSAVQPAARGTMYLAMGRAALAYVLASGALAWLAFGAVRAAGGWREEKRRDDGFVVGTRVQESTHAG